MRGDGKLPTAVVTVLLVTASVTAGVTFVTTGSGGTDAGDGTALAASGSELELTATSSGPTKQREEVRIRFRLENEGTESINNSGVVDIYLNPDLPPGWEVVTRNDDGGNWDGDRWSWLGIDAGEVKRPSITLRAPSNATGTVDVEAVVRTHGSFPETVAATTETVLVDDRFEANDGYDSGEDPVDGTYAYVDGGTYTDLYKGADDPDWYVVDGLSEGDTVDAAIAFDHGEGNLDLALFYPDADGFLRVERSSSDTDDEAVSVTVPNTTWASESLNAVLEEAVLVTVTGDDPNETAGYTLEVGGDPANEPPNASFAVSPTAPVTGASVTFGAAASSDADGTIVSYEWDFDGDGTVDATGASVNHTYSTAGTYVPTLTVTDDDGATDTDSAVLNVTDAGAGDAAVLDVVPDERTVGTRATTTARVVARNASGGVDDFDVEVSVGDTRVATVTNGTIVAEAQLTSVSVGADNATVQLRGVNVTAGSAPATLAEVVLEAADAPGETTLSVTGDPVVADETDTEYAVTTDGATLRVRESAAPDVDGNGRPATDPDGDGRYEDVDGDGTFDILDVSLFLETFDRPAVADNAAAFDFDTDGDIDILDVSRLLDEL